MTLQPLPSPNAMRPHGFSLLEMLVSVALIGIIAALALSILPNINLQSTQTRDRRNAQELAAICATAQAAGVDFVATGDLEQTVKNIVSGGKPADGAFAGNYFGLPGLAPVDQTTAMTYLQLVDGSLEFRPYP